MIGLLTGQECFLVGVEDDPQTGGIRLFVGARYNGVYAVTTDPDAMRQARDAWESAGHVTITTPRSDQLYTLEERP